MSDVNLESLSPVADQSLKTEADIQKVDFQRYRDTQLAVLPESTLDGEFRPEERILINEMVPLVSNARADVRLAKLAPTASYEEKKKEVGLVGTAVNQGVRLSIAATKPGDIVRQYYKSGGGGGRWTYESTADLMRGHCIAAAIVGRGVRAGQAIAEIAKLEFSKPAVVVTELAPVLNQLRAGKLAELDTAKNDFDKDRNGF